MFEKRAKGAELSKRVGYFYIILAILVLVAAVLLDSSAIAIGVAFYLVMFAVVYLLSTKFKDNRYTWICLIICAIATLLFSLSLVGLCLALLLAVAANDLRKELD